MTGADIQAGQRVRIDRASSLSSRPHRITVHVEHVERPTASGRLVVVRGRRVVQTRDIGELWKAPSVWTLWHDDEVELVRASA